MALRFIARVRVERGEDFADRADGVTVPDLLPAMRQFLADLSAPAKLLNDIHAAWVRGDLATMYEVVSRSPMFAHPALREALLTKRNQAWAKVLRSLSQSKQRTLVVVGALHLYGPSNVLELLNYSVQQLPIDG